MNYEDSVYYFVVIIFLIIFSSILITAFIFEIKEEYSAYYFVKEPPQSIIPGKDYCETFIIENHYNKDLFYHYTIDMFIERTLYASYGKDVVYSEEKDLGDVVLFLHEQDTEKINFCYSIEDSFNYAKIKINFLNDNQNLFFIVTENNVL